MGSRPMRILLSCLQGAAGHPIPAYAQWRRHFTNGLREGGHEVHEIPGVDWAEGLVHPAGPALEAWKARSWDAALAFARTEHGRAPIDLWLGYLFPRQIEPAAIETLQRLGIPCVNFFCDNLREFRRPPAALRPFALHWVPELEALPMYRAEGLPHLHAPMPCWVPEALRRPPEAETEPATFIGSADLLRRDFLARSFAAGADLVVRGPGWDEAPSPPVGARARTRRPLAAIAGDRLARTRSHGAGVLLREVERRVRPLRPRPISHRHLFGAVSDADYVRITREAQVTIGLNRVPTLGASDRRPLVYSRLRDLEAPMLGACYLAEWSAGLEHLFEPGREIETFRTPEELAAQLAALKRDPKRRGELRARAQRRALAEHSVTRSLERIRAALGIAGAAKA